MEQITRRASVEALKKQAAQYADALIEVLKRQEP